jgi:hypothetical protein
MQYGLYYIHEISFVIIDDKNNSHGAGTDGIMRKGKERQKAI